MRITIQTLICLAIVPYIISGTPVKDVQAEIDNIHAILEKLQTKVNVDHEKRLLDVEHTKKDTGAMLNCGSAPCENGGSCIDVSTDVFVCSCRSGYFGLTCSESFTDATFFAVLTNNVQGEVNPIVFDNAVINGGYYDVLTGKYTVPYDGIYQFNVFIQHSLGNTMVEMYVDDSQVNAHIDYNAPYTDYTYYRPVTIIQALTAGQTVHVATGGTEGGARGSATSYASYFSGYLISAN